MTTPSRFLAALVAVFFLMACDSPEKTIRTIRTDLDAFKKNPTPSAQKSLEEAFADIHLRIRHFEEAGDTLQADLFKRQALTLAYEYRAVCEALAQKNPGLFQSRPRSGK